MIHISKYFFSFLMIMIFLSGCNNENTSKHYLNTRDEAIKSFIKDQSYQGTGIVIEIANHETIILYNPMKDVYYSGEVFEQADKFFAERTSAGVDIGNTSGAMWTFKTGVGNEYTLKISKDYEDTTAIYNKKLDLYISIVKGKRDYSETKKIENVIKADQIFEM